MSQSLTKHQIFLKCDLRNDYRVGEGEIEATIILSTIDKECLITHIHPILFLTQGGEITLELIGYPDISNWEVRNNYTSTGINSYNNTLVSKTSSTLVVGVPALPSNLTSQIEIYLYDPNQNMYSIFAYISITSSMSIVSISPSIGGDAGGTAVTITGSGFDTITTPATSVTFGGTQAPLVTRLNDSTMICVSPAHAPGYVDIVVTEGSTTATLVKSFQYLAASALVTETQRVVSTLNLQNGISNSLDQKLANMRLTGDDLSKGEIQGAIGKNNAFATEVKAQSGYDGGNGSKININDAKKLLDLSGEINRSLIKLSG